MFFNNWVNEKYAKSDNEPIYDKFGLDYLLHVVIPECNFKKVTNSARLY